MIKPKFKIGQKVYHVTPDSDQGVILDCIYYLRSDRWMYMVTFGPDKNPIEYYEDELSTSKTF